MLAKLSNLGIFTVQDLLFHLPSRYLDKTRIQAIGSIKLGDTVQLQGEVRSCSIAFGKRRSLQCQIQDTSGTINLRFFHFNAAQKNALHIGASLRCYGEIRRGRGGFEIYHPEYQLLDPGENTPLDDKLSPIYPRTEGLQQARLVKIIDQALNLFLQAQDKVSDYLPDEIRQQLGLMDITQAIAILHRPPREASIELLLQGKHPAQQRLCFEELLSHRLCMRRLRIESDKQIAPAMAPAPSLCNAFQQQLGFQLTRAQQSTSAEISKDLSRSLPMLRLLQGDVGSGKTVVAALAALQAIDNGFQVALMAPTEILAEQHYVNFCHWFKPLNLKIGWLSGKTKGVKRKEQLSDLAGGHTQIILGTHALFQDQVVFSKLGLIIVDEQHRFGVHQRLSLREKANGDHGSPHQLVMTATPIPRTLAMSAYADLDCSIIDELPPGRTPINTVVLSNNRRDDVIARISFACQNNNQAYWVCTLIEESDVLQCQAAESTAELLAQQLPNIKIGLIHGRMKPQQKAEIMADFKNGLLQLLVATTVIEVGVDVPNASLMVIENAERLGLSQLHQLRGRVGRGSQASHCLMLYQSPLSFTSKKRLAVMRESTDGFYIAEKDLEIRGPGQMLGTRQTGLMSFKVADIVRDAQMLDQVKDSADLILNKYPESIAPLINRWLGNKDLYANV